MIIVIARDKFYIVAAAAADLVARRGSRVFVLEEEICDYKTCNKFHVIYSEYN